jgi:PAS domain-containing protein
MGKERKASNRSGSGQKGRQSAALRALEKRIQIILDSVEEGYIEVDLKGTTVLCNKAFSRIVGHCQKLIYAWIP